MTIGYLVDLCRSCDHPGGQHYMESGCRLCGCEEWTEPARRARWTDEMTGLAKARPTASYQELFEVSS